ncbi:MAG TPA: hypothetical protein VFY73_09115 [Ideonella sp.]|uniref:hypothetical protein n=1 Tax=Ideonella sp. TaxID=1929293 RepID=UPI002E312C7E|nr:hypothetical protein [Ideonella sp.]HEX5684183.1 hypothetical protein [Ideonella sp.]
MPEQLTKHPEVTLQVLRSSGAECAQGAAQKILTQCPAERFCKLPGGEICVFGLPDAPRMTQMTAADWRALVPAAPAEASKPDGSFGKGVLLSGGVGIMAGAIIGMLAMRLWRVRT